MKINAFATLKQQNYLTKYHYQIQSQDHAVVVQIYYCGLCRSDIHFMQNTWGDSIYPLVPGHEILGKIISIGDKVPKHYLHKKVAIAWQQSACGKCYYCQQQQENHCQKIQAIGIGSHGGFADYIQTNYNFVHIVPEQFFCPQLAPLLCAGTTVYNAMQKLSIQKNMRIAVIGIGGIGHLAIKFLTALKCHVLACTHPKTDNNTILSLGAKVAIHSDDINRLKKYSHSYDALFLSTDAKIDLSLFIQLLKPQAKLAILAMPKVIEIPSLDLIVKEISIIGIQAGNKENVAKTLEFAYIHNIQAEIKQMAMKDINLAINLQNQQYPPYYRIVLCNEITN